MNSQNTHIKNILQLFPDQETKNWLIEKMKAIKKKKDAKHFYLSFGQVHRFIGNETIYISLSELGYKKETQVKSIKVSWTFQQLSRVALMLALEVKDNKTVLKQLFTTADMNELTAVYKGLFLLNNAEEFTSEVEEGVRTNITKVFDAISLNNPYPASYFSEEAWNQMVLKAIFMQRPIYGIYGLENRKNRKLAKIVQDFAHERWSAGRSVTPEIWRLTDAFVDEELFADLQMVILSDTILAKEAAIKCIEGSSFMPAKEWLTFQNIETTNRTWNEIGESIHLKHT